MNAHVEELNLGVATADMQRRKRVQRGVDLLDEKVLDWRERVDSTRLDMGSTTYCVLGQLSDGAYTASLISLGIEGKGYEYGFDPMFGDSDRLTALWKAEIRSQSH